MDFTEYNPLADPGAVATLWRRVFPSKYQVTDRVLIPRLAGRPSYDPGDGVAVWHDGELIAFGIAEIPRGAGQNGDTGFIQVLMVTPEFQKQRIGCELLGRLEARMRAAGCKSAAAGSSPWRFWSGVPDDLASACAFFEKHGYHRNYTSIDMYGTIDGPPATDTAAVLIREHGIDSLAMDQNTLPAAAEFLGREQPGWRESMLMMAAAGDAANVLLFRHQGVIVGAIQTYTPASRWRGPNVVWEHALGERTGGFGAVLIARSHRGRGLGRLLCRAAVDHISNAGGTGFYIDWTSEKLAPFYGAVGARTCATFGMYRRDLTGVSPQGRT